ncbi:MAG: flavin reductase [Bacilli bacterium]|nr:flavin reductase [Bacilli bacterium]
MNKILNKISQGMYILTTKNGGCCVDSVSQISSGDNPLIAVAVMKGNYTNKLMKENNTFALSIIGTNTDTSVIKTYGMNSSKDYNKFENSDTIVIDNLHIIKNSLGYIICDKVNAIENETHTLFIGKVIKSELYKDDEPMTYQYYQNHKEDLINIELSNGEKAWICTICGYIYYGDNLPDDYKCPICKVDKNLFKLK